MREDIRSTQYQVGNTGMNIDDFNSNRMEDQIRKKTANMEKQLDQQFNNLRIQMRRVQVKHDRLKALKEELRRLQKWLELGYDDDKSVGIGGAVGGIRQIEEALLEQYRALKREDRDNRREDEKSVHSNQLVSDMVSDLSKFNSDKGVSELTGATE